MDAYSNHKSLQTHLNVYPGQGQNTQYIPLQEQNGNDDSSYDPWLQPGRSSSPLQPDDGGRFLDRTQPAPKISAWTLELCAITTSVAALVAIIAILYREDDKPLAAWSLKVSLNTVISTLGTVSRTSLAFALSACLGQHKWNWLSKKPSRLIAFERFDQASRGPWGAILLLIWLRLKHWAAIGAVVTIATVAFDPFLQAVISTYGRLDTIITSNENAIGQAVRIDGGARIENTAGAIGSIRTEFGIINHVTVQTQPDFGVVSSVYRGFYNGTGSNQTVRFDCSTGNCTWTSFVSAAICSTCNDVSNQIQKSSAIGTNGSNVPFPTNFQIRRPYTMFRLPHSDIRNVDARSGFSGGEILYDTQRLNDVRTFMTANVTYDVYETITFQKYETLLMAFTMMRASEDYLTNKTSWEQTTPIATECALYLCAKEFKTQANNSVLEEEVVNSWATRDPKSFKKGNYTDRINSRANISGWIEAQGNRFYHPLIDPPRTDLRLTIPPAAPTKLRSTSDLYITHRFIRSTIDFFLDFTGVNALKPGAVLAFPQTSGTPFIEALWTSTNLTETFNNVAVSMTNQLRDVSQQRNGGAAQSWTIHVSVRWPYLSYTITMVVFGILYVVLMIVDSRRLGLRVWKESSLPSLLYGFDEETQSLLRGLDERAKVSKGSVVQSKGDVLVAMKYDGKAEFNRLTVV